MLQGPVQIAYGVGDVRRAAAEWAERGVGPFFVREHIAVDDVTVRGRPGTFDHSSAYGWWGPVMVELICQHDGGPDPIVGADGAVHHVAYFVDDYATAGAHLAGRGWPAAMTARTRGGTTEFAFHDARSELGHYVEIYERTTALAGFYDHVRTTATTWDGTDPIRVV